MTDETENTSAPLTPVPAPEPEHTAPGSVIPGSFIINHVNEHSVHFATRVKAPSEGLAESTLLAAHTDNRVMAIYPDTGQTEQDGFTVVDLDEEP